MSQTFTQEDWKEIERDVAEFTRRVVGNAFTDYLNEPSTLKDKMCGVVRSLLHKHIILAKVVEKQEEQLRDLELKLKNLYEYGG